VILLDLMMPVMDGWEYREQQRRDPDLTAIPVVVLSAVARSHRSIDAAEVLAKPFDLDALLAAVRRHC
jgi:CheY-like chemotaxis protein